MCTQNLKIKKKKKTLPEKGVCRPFNFQEVEEIRISPVNPDPPHDVNIINWILQSYSRTNKK